MEKPEYKGNLEHRVLQNWKKPVWKSGAGYQAAPKAKTYSTGQSVAPSPPRVN